MNLSELSRLVGGFLFVFAMLLLLPIGIAVWDERLVEGRSLFPPSLTAFLGTFFLTLAAAILLLFLGRKAKGEVYRREGLLAVVLIWFIIPLFSATPFVLSKTLENPVQAYFELVSGYTTTGSTVLQPKKYDPITQEEIPYTKTLPGVLPKKSVWYGTIEPIRDSETGDVVLEGVEAIGRPLQFWRSFSQWLGGGGVIVLFVAILPFLGVAGKVLFQAEIPGPIKEGIAPRIKETALHLWKIYMVLSLLQLGLTLVLIREIPFFDALCLTLTTLSTGGFTITNESIATYQNGRLELLLAVFMILGSINFSLYYQIGKGRIHKLFNGEFFLFMTLLGLFGLFSSLPLIGAPQVDLQGRLLAPYTAVEALQSGFFHVISAMTTTGYATTDYDLWPYFPQVMLLIAMFLGGMSGSTAGGIKMMRHIILFKTAQHKIESISRPHLVKSFRLEGRTLDENASAFALVFFLTLIALTALGTLLYVADGYDPETALGLVACMVNNVGLSFRLAGPLENCASMSNFSLLVSSLLMIGGRLEFFALLAICTPSFWRR